MRVLLTTQPGYGHFRPLLPLAHALVAAGHEVRIGTSASFGGAVEREGLTAEAVGQDWLHGVESTIPADLQPPPQANTLATYFRAQVRAHDRGTPGRRCRGPRRPMAS